MFTRIFSILRSIIAILFSFISNSILVSLFLTFLVTIVDVHQWKWVQTILQWLKWPVTQNNAFALFFWTQIIGASKLYFANRRSRTADRGRLLTAVRDPRPAACEPRLDADGCPRPATRGLRTAACGTAASRLHSILYMFRSPLAKGLQHGHQGESPCCHGILHFRGHLGIFVPVDQPVPFQFL